MCTVWSSAETGFSTKGLWKTWPSTSIVSSVSISVSLVEAGGRVGGRKGRREEGRERKGERGGEREEGGERRGEGHSFAGHHNIDNKHHMTSHDPDTK